MLLATISGLTITAQSQNISQADQKKASQTRTKTALGTWRGVFKTRPDVEVPFNFDIERNKSNTERIVFRNAEERFDGGQVTYRGDSVFVHLDQFDNEMALKLSGDSLTGVLRKQGQTEITTPITATRGTNYRFKPNGEKALADFSGKYDIVFKSANGTEENAVGIFKQIGNKLTGTFLRITGDSRYLEGAVEGNTFYLSSFIGSGPSYFKGEFLANGTLNGEVISARGNQPFSGAKNENAALPDANKLTFLKDGYKTLDFSFPDVNGKKISLSDEKYKNKVVILTITGTWCPNCVDEASFIAPWYKANKKRGVEVIALHYERQLDSAYVRKVLTRFREKFGVQYDQVIVGKPDKQVVAESLPALKNFLSFPTTIIINKKGEVAKIHTGYSGPATGKYYTDFVREFNTEINQLLKD